MTPSVSVVVPAHNHVRYIEYCLRSIFAQTTAPAELLVIDDGSSDGTVAAIERLLPDAPFPVTFIARKNRGLSATLNEGLDRTSGDFFAYLGSDDIWLPTFLETCSGALRARSDAVLAYSNCYIIDGEGRVLADTRDRYPYEDGNVTRMLLSGLAPPLSPAVLHRRTCVSEHRWNEHSPLEDYELYLKLSAAGEFAFVDKTLAAWRRHADNTSRKLDAMLDAQLDAIARVGPTLGLDATELRRSVDRVMWLSAQNFLTAGQRHRASSMSLRALRGAPGAASILRRAAQLALPVSASALRGAWSERRATSRYGTVGHVDQ